jgi:hypothetical protein
MVVVVGFLLMGEAAVILPVVVAVGHQEEVVDHQVEVVGHQEEVVDLLVVAVLLLEEVGDHQVAAAELAFFIFNIRRATFTCLTILYNIGSNHVH